MPTSVVVCVARTKPFSHAILCHAALPSFASFLQPGGQHGAGEPQPMDDAVHDGTVPAALQLDVPGLPPEESHT